jgi:hypothetical protein
MGVWMAGVVRETWQRLLGSLVSAAKREARRRPSSSVLCMSAVGCRYSWDLGGRCVSPARWK